MAKAWPTKGSYRHPDLVGLFDLIGAVYGQSSDFFLGGAVLGLVPDCAEDVGLATLRIDGVAHALAVDGQALVGRGILCVPALQGTVEQSRLHPDEHLADKGAAGHLVAAIAVAAAKTRGPSALDPVPIG